MQDREKIEKIRMTPVELNSTAGARLHLVPITLAVVNQITQACHERLKDFDYYDKAGKEELKKLSNKVSGCRPGTKKMPGRVSREVARTIISDLERLKVTVDTPEFEWWKTVVNNEDVSWEYVKEVEKTKIVETEYDLTVPGYETFAGLDGIVMSNTMNFNVPSTDAAIKDVVGLMMPSSTLKSTSDFKSANWNPRMESVAGLFSASQAPEESDDRGHKIRPKVFATVKDAKEALLRGDIHPSDPVMILEGFEGKT